MTEEMTGDLTENIEALPTEKAPEETAEKELSGQKLSTKELSTEEKLQQDAIETGELPVSVRDASGDLFPYIIGK